MTYYPDDPSSGVTRLGKGKNGRQSNAAYLSPDQFMSMRRVKNLAALDSGTGGSVGDLIPHKQREIEEGQGDTVDYDALAGVMEHEGSRGTTVPPIWVKPGSSTGYDAEGTLGNGGHRVALAHELGWKTMRYTRDRAQSGYGDDRFQLNDGDYDDYSSDSSSYEPGDLADPRWQPGGRSHIPGQTGDAGPGQRWHAGKTHGLYTELHGALNKQQFGGPRPTDERRHGQQVLPGMHVTWNKGRSANERNDPVNGPLGGKWTGGEAGPRHGEMTSAVGKLAHALRPMGNI